MTLEEKIRIIKENEDKNYLFISPRMIQGGARLISSYESLDLYENMVENTSKFAEKEIVNLIANAEHNNKEEKRYLDFYLIFCGDFDDLPDDLGSIIDFIMGNKDKIVAVYRYVKGTETRQYFVGFAQGQTICEYECLYLSLEELLRIFEENNIKCEIDITVNRNISSLYRDDRSTKFVISYNPKKELESEKDYSLKKLRK